jgi:hypothetical protein
MHIMEFVGERGRSLIEQRKVGTCDCKVHRNIEEARGARRGMIKSRGDF